MVPKMDDNAINCDNWNAIKPSTLKKVLESLTVCTCAPTFKFFYPPPNGGIIEYKISLHKFSDFSMHVLLWFSEQCVQVGKCVLLFKWITGPASIATTGNRWGFLFLVRSNDWSAFDQLWYDYWPTPRKYKIQTSPISKINKSCEVFQTWVMHAFMSCFPQLSTE